MKILGVDLGERRIGFAISDPEERIAMSLCVCKIKNQSEIIPAIIRIANEQEAELIILGYPRNLNGKAGIKARESEAFAVQLNAHNLNTMLWDERLTTSEADRLLQETSLSRRQRKNHIDAVAAQRILSSYLDARSRKP